MTVERIGILTLNFRRLKNEWVDMKQLSLCSNNIIEKLQQYFNENIQLLKVSHLFTVLSEIKFCQNELNRKCNTSKMKNFMKNGT